MLTRLQNTPTTGNTAYRFQYSGTTAVIDKKADQAAHYLFDIGHGDHGTLEKPRAYSDLSLAEKLAILDKYVLSVILDASMSHRANTDAEAARAVAIATEESELIT